MRSLVLNQRLVRFCYVCFPSENPRTQNRTNLTQQRW